MSANYNQGSGNDGKSANQNQMYVNDQLDQHQPGNPANIGDNGDNGVYINFDSTPSPEVISPNNGRGKKKLNPSIFIPVIISIFAITIAMVSCGVAVAALEKVNKNTQEDTTARIQQVESRLNEVNDSLDLKIKVENNTGRIEKLEEETEKLNSRWTPDPGWFSPSTRYQYRLTDVPRSWTGGRDWCRRQGGDLAAVGMRNIEMRRMIYNALPTDGLGRMWIGLSDVEQEGTYVWVDGVLGTSSNIHWNTDEPNNHGGDEDCCEIPSQTHNLINDNSCENAYYGICEKRLQ